MEFGFDSRDHGSAEAEEDHTAAAGTASAIEIGDAPIGPDDFLRLIDGAQLVLMPAVFERVRKSTQRFDEYAATRAIYGQNRGVGSKAGLTVSEESVRVAVSAILQDNTSRVGDSLDPREIRGALLYRVLTITNGRSGVSENALRMLLSLIDSSDLKGRKSGSIGEADIPENTSVLELGLSSNDLARLSPRDALGLVSHNGYGVTLATLALEESTRAVDACALSGGVLHASLGLSNESFSAPALEARPLSEREAGERYSTMDEKIDAPPSKHLQPPLSFRCQALDWATAREQLEALRVAIGLELASTADNPELTSDGAVVHTANFHPMRLASATASSNGLLAMLAGGLEQRVHRAMEAEWNGIGEGLVSNLNLDGGIRGVGRTIASLGARTRSMPVQSWRFYAGTVGGGLEDHATLLPTECDNLRVTAKLLYELAGLEASVAMFALEARGGSILDPALEAEIRALAVPF